MKKLYLIGAVIFVILILIAATAQFGATCTWYLFASQASPVMVLLQMAALGGVVGGLLVLFWKSPDEDSDDDESDETPAE